MTESETDTQTNGEPIPGEKVICLFPGCEREAVPPPKTAVEGRSGPHPRYCAIEEHNASSTFQELKRLENERSEKA